MSYVSLDVSSVVASEINKMQISNSKLRTISVSLPAIYMHPSPQMQTSPIETKSLIQEGHEGSILLT